MIKAVWFLLSGRWKEGRMRTTRRHKGLEVSPEHWTIVLDIDKFDIWFNAHVQICKMLGRTFTISDVARRMNYSPSYWGKLIREARERRQNIEISARFMGTAEKTFGIWQEEWFSVVPVCQEGRHQQDKPYSPVTNFIRPDSCDNPRVRYAR